MFCGEHESNTSLVLQKPGNEVRFTQEKMKADASKNGYAYL